MRMKRLLMVVCLLYSTGCAAGKIYIDRTNDSYASCTTIEKELQLAQKRIGILEEKDHILQNIRDAFLSIAQLAFSPIVVFNTILTLSDSNIADIAETKALTDRQDGMIAISNQKNCGYRYAMHQGGTGPNFFKKQENNLD